MRAEPPTRRRGVDAPSRPQRGVFERLFPSMFSLWRVVRRVRPSSPRADQPTRLTPRRFQGRPAQAALENAPGPAPAPVEELVLEAAPPLAAGPQGRPVVESQPSTPQADSLPPGYQEPPPSRAEIRLTQSPPSRLQADRATSQRQAPAPTPPRVDHSTTQRTPPGQERSEGPVDARGTPTADRTEPGQPSRPPDVESEGSRAELEENSERAREEIKTTQAVRREAASERRRAQRALDESDGFQRETARVMAHARVSFAKAVALNPGALKNMGSNIKALEEAIKTEGHLRRLTRQQAEQEADGARQRAIQSILTALAAVRKASDQAGRELEESRRIAAMAESHRDSSETDLNRGRTIKAEAESQIRQEASRLLREPSGGDIGFPEESLTLIDLGLDAFPEETFSSKLAEAPQLPISPAVERPVEGVWPTVEERHPPPSQYERAIDPPAPGITEPVQEQAVPREHTPVGQDRAEMASTHNLESALNDFLAAIEMGAAPGDEAIPEPPAVNSEGLFLDNLDFSRARSEAAQPPRSFDAGDGHATNGEVVRRPPPSSQPQASQPQASQPQASQPQASQPQAAQAPQPQARSPRPRSAKPRSHGEAPRRWNSGMSCWAR